MKFIYRVSMKESERGWGSKTYNEDFDTYEAAEAYIKRIAEYNNEEYARTNCVPDYYIQTNSDKIEIIKVL